MINSFSYENQYAGYVDRILYFGYEQYHERTKLKTKRIPHAYFEVNERIWSSTPILQCKELKWKSAIEEILWIMQKGSNNIHDLRPHIWDEWADKDGSIGKAYGYQISEYKQVEKALDRLKKDPSDRRAVINLWNPADLDQMNLVPCVFASVWTIVNGKLYGMITQRSADFALGVPFNTFQYYALLLMFSKHLNVKPGGLLHTMADAHIYENHYEGMKTYLNRFNMVRCCYTERGELKDNPTILNCYYHDVFKDPEKNIFSIHIEDETTFLEMQKMVNEFVNQNPTLEVPELRLETDKTNFWDFTIDDFVLDNYIHFPTIKFDVAV